jgi:dihydroorotase
VAISDDGFSVKDTQLMRKALEYAKMLGLVVIAHCENTELTGDGVMNEGFYSTLLGMKGIPNAAESTIVARDILLAELTGAALHIAHVSTKESTWLIREAKQRGVPVTAETCPHYFSLSDEQIKSYDTSLKVSPPLRSAEDIKQIKSALKDGTIDVISTDHAPHTEAEKDVEFDQAPCGMIGLETALSLALEELVSNKILHYKQIVEKMSSKPAQILGLKSKGTLSPGSDADITIVDPAKEWAVDKAQIASKSKNTPFIGRKLKARVRQTIVGGRTGAEK